MSRRAAIVVGGGIAGLASAIALRQAGYAVTLLERAERIEPVGAAISLWPNAMAALDALGAAARVRAEAAPIRSLCSATRDGRPILARGSAGAFLPTRTLVQAALLDAAAGVELRLGSAATAIADHGDAVEVRVAAGAPLRAELAVVADGIWSASATALLGTRPHYCGYGGVLGLSGPLAAPLPAGMSAEYNGARERFGTFDLGGGRGYWFYMRDDRASAACRSITRDDVAARAIGWPEVVGRLVAATAPGALVPFAVHARPAPRRLGRGRVICVGDAAHAMEPNLGQGACQGLEDAVAVGAAAARHAPDQLLPAFEAMRLARIRGFVRRSGQGRLGSHAPRPVRLLARGLVRALPERIHDRIFADMYRLPDY